jgi:hypothetical protein
VKADSEDGRADGERENGEGASNAAIVEVDEPIEPPTAFELALTAERAALADLVRSGKDCGICCLPFTAGTTALLECAHTVHVDCAKEELQQDRKLRCRECGHEELSVSTEDEVDRLPANPRLEAHLAEAAQTVCVACRADEDMDEAGWKHATHRCADCGGGQAMLCAHHAAMHPARKLTRDHVVEKLAATTAADGAFLCRVHPDQRLELFCMHCLWACCVACAASHCKKHDTPSVEDALPVLHKKMDRAQQDATFYQIEVETWLAEAALLPAAIEEHYAGLRAKTDAIVDGLRRKLDLVQKRIHANLAEDKDAQLHTLATLKDEVRLMWLTTHQANETIKQLLQEEGVSPAHVAAVGGPVSDHLLGAAEGILPPLPAANLANVVPVPDNLDMVLDGGLRLVHGLAFGPRCNAEGVRPVVYTTFETTVVVRTHTRTGAPVTSGDDKVHVLIEGRAGEPAPGATITATNQNDGTYVVRYMIAAVGAYKVHINVNGQAVNGSPFAVTARLGLTLRFTGPPYYDNCGLFYWLGTLRRTQEWRNPAHDRQAVRVTLSSNQRGRPPGRLVGNAPPQGHNNFMLCTDDAEASWMMLELLGSVWLRPTGYVLSTDRNGIAGSHLLRNWRLVGSADGGRTWKQLCVHSRDASVTSDHPSMYWTIDDATNEFYHRFRLELTGVDSNLVFVLAATSMELYGDVNVRV